MQVAGPVQSGDMVVRSNQASPGITALLAKESRKQRGIFELPPTEEPQKDFYNMALDNVQNQLRSAAQTVNAMAPEGESLAYINPQEEGILRLLGGSGQPEPVTGIPSFAPPGRGSTRRNPGFTGSYSRSPSSGGGGGGGNKSSGFSGNVKNKSDQQKMLKEIDKAMQEKEARDNKKKSVTQMSAKELQDIVNKSYQDTGVAISDEGRISFASDPDLYKGGGYRYGDKSDDDGKKDEFASGTLGESQKSALDKYIARDIPLKDDRLMQTLAGARLMGDKGLFTSDYNKRLQKSLAAMGLGGKNIFGTYLTPEGRDYYQGLGGGSSGLGDLASNVSGFGVLGLLKNLFGGDPEELSIADRMERAKRAREAMENQQRRRDGGSQPTPEEPADETEEEEDEDEFDYFSYRRRLMQPMDYESIIARAYEGSDGSLLQNLGEAIKERDEA